MSDQISDHEVEEQVASLLTAEPVAARVRFRIWFGKDGALRYISHLDLARVWERVVRRAGLPLLYSQGFNPRPRIQLASGLPLGYASTCEVLDIWLEAEPPPVDEMLASVRAACPDGLNVLRVEQVDLHLPPLQTITRAATYRVKLAAHVDGDSLARAVSELLSQAEIWRVRREKRYDLRALVESLEIVSVEQPELSMTLRLDAVRGSGRADEVLQALGLDPLEAQITRTAIHFAED